MLVALLVLQSSLSVGPLTPRTTTVTTTETSDAYEQVASAYQAHLLEFDVRNVNGIANEYEGNATVRWTGDIPGLPGNYSGSDNIKILLGASIGKFFNFSLSNENQSIAVKGNVSTVNSTFDFAGYSSVYGPTNGTVVAKDIYERAGSSSWLIASEIWNFTQFNESFPST
jgi:hypothetical protein